MSYVTWGSADAVPPGQEGPGDLACFAGLGTGGHMGIVLGPNQMVSALDSSQGTLISPIQGYGPAGAPLVYRRIRGTGIPPTGGAQTTAAEQGWGSMLLPLLAGLAVGAGIIGAVLALAAAATIGLGWALTRAGQEVG